MCGNDRIIAAFCVSRWFLMIQGGFDMFSIGEVSKISQVSLRMLRYYDKNDLFKPKIINKENGYRYYSAEQLDDLYRIVELRDIGFSVSEIKNLIDLDDKDVYIQAMEAKITELSELIEQTNMKLRHLNALKEDMKGENHAVESDITLVLKKIPTQNVISYRKTVKDYFCESQMWAEFTELVVGSEINASSKCFSLYHDRDYREEDVDIELCVVVDEKMENLPEGLKYRQVEGCEHAVSMIIRGPYDNISPAYRKFAYWLENHPEYKMAGPNRQICYVCGADTDNPEEYVTELLIPLEMK